VPCNPQKEKDGKTAEKPFSTDGLGYGVGIRVTKR